MFEGLANSKEDWIARVNAADGLEMLFARDWRVLVASPRVWIESGQQAADHLGKSLWDYPFLRPGRSGLESLALFDGQTRCLKLSIDLHFNGRGRMREFDFWPIMLNDGTILVHLVGVARQGAPLANPAKSGFRILDLRAIPFSPPRNEAV